MEERRLLLAVALSLLVLTAYSLLFPPAPRPPRRSRRRGRPPAPPEPGSAGAQSTRAAPSHPGPRPVPAPGHGRERAEGRSGRTRPGHRVHEPRGPPRVLAAAPLPGHAGPRRGDGAAPPPAVPGRSTSRPASPAWIARLRDGALQALGGDPDACGPSGPAHRCASTSRTVRSRRRRSFILPPAATWSRCGCPCAGGARSCRCKLLWGPGSATRRRRRARGPGVPARRKGSPSRRRGGARSRGQARDESDAGRRPLGRGGEPLLRCAVRAPGGIGTAEVRPVPLSPGGGREDGDGAGGGDRPRRAPGARPPLRGPQGLPRAGAVPATGSQAAVPVGDWIGPHRRPPHAPCCGGCTATWATTGGRSSS